MIPIEYLSHSRIELYRKNPVFYKKQYIDKVVARESTPAQALGSLLHAMVLEPESVEEKFKLAPMVDKRTKAGKEEWEQFQKGLADDVTIITRDDVSMANRMIEAINENSASSYYLHSTNGIKEEEIHKPMMIDDQQIGCKIIPDVYSAVDGFLVDLKTVSSYDPLDWAKEAHFSGYLRQLAFYRLFLRYHSIYIHSCVHIVVDKGEFPTCMVVEFDSSDIDRAENQVYESIRKLLASHETGVFQPHHYGLVPKLTVPAWAWR